jgi:hypothetical protein
MALIHPHLHLQVLVEAEGVMGSIVLQHSLKALVAVQAGVQQDMQRPKQEEQALPVKVILAETERLELRLVMLAAVVAVEKVRWAVVLLMELLLGVLVVLVQNGQQVLEHFTRVVAVEDQVIPQQ